MTESTIRTVRFRNTADKKVVVVSPTLNLRREFPTKGVIQEIPFEMVEQLMFDAGFLNLINSGVLYIDNMEDKIDLGIEAPDTEIPTNVVVFSDAEKVRLLTQATREQFLERLSHVTYEEAAELVRFAAKNDIYNPEKSEILKEITGMDVVGMIAKKREFEEADRRAAANSSSSSDRKPPEGVFRPLAR